MSDTPDGSANDPLRTALRRHIALTGISERRLAIAAGLSPSAVSDIFKAKSQHPRQDTLVKLARYLGTTIEKLTTDRGLSEPQSELQPPEPVTVHGRSSDQDTLVWHTAKQLLIECQRPASGPEIHAEANRLHTMMETLGTALTFLQRLEFSASERRSVLEQRNRPPPKG